MVRSEEKKADLTVAIKSMENLVEALKEIRDTDASEASILSKYGLKPGFFRAAVYTSIFENDDGKLQAFREKYINEGRPTSNWHEDLFCAIYGLSKGASSIGKIPPNIGKKIEKALETLTVREEKVIKLRYRDGLSLDEAAPKIGTSKERVRQIEQKALRKLRSPNRLAYMMIDDGFYIDRAAMRRKIETDYFVKERKKELDKYDAAIEGKKAVLYRMEHKEAIFNHDTKKMVILETTIEECDFSVRTYNCLKRRGIETVGDILQLTEKELFKIRNLGRKSLDELDTFLYAYGFELKKEDK